MKKAIVILAALAASAAMQAQVSYGVRAGANFSNVTFSGDGESESEDSRFGFNIGASLELPIKGGFGLETGLYYTSKGCKHSYESGSESTYAMDYLQVPLMAQYKFGVAPVADVKVFAGPFVAYGIGGGSTFKDDDGKETDGDSVFGDDGYKRFDFGLRIGAGVDLAKNYYVGIGYDLGLMDIDRSGEFGMGDDFSTRTGSFFVQVGYNF